MHNQNKDNHQSKINKQQEAPENQTSWNSNNQGIEEKTNQNNQIGTPRQRNMDQMKEQSKTSEKDLSNEETVNLVIKMLTVLTELA